MSLNAPLRCEQILYQTSTTSEIFLYSLDSCHFAALKYSEYLLIKIGLLVFVASMAATAKVTSPLRSDPVKQCMTNAEDCLFS